MTNNLKCPFCGAELKGFGPCRQWCSNNDCDGSLTAAPEKVWRALIDGKKAQDALQKIATDFPLIPGSMQLQEHVWHKHYDRIKDIARTEIASITKQENNNDLA